MSSMYVVKLRLHDLKTNDSWLLVTNHILWSKSPVKDSPTNHRPAHDSDFSHSALEDVALGGRRVWYFGLSQILEVVSFLHIRSVTFCSCTHQLECSTQTRHFIACLQTQPLYSGSLLRNKRPWCPAVLTRTYTSWNWRTVYTNCFLSF